MFASDPSTVVVVLDSGFGADIDDGASVCALTNIKDFSPMIRNNSMLVGTGEEGDNCLDTKLASDSFFDSRKSSIDKRTMRIGSTITQTT